MNNRLESWAHAMYSQRPVISLAEAKKILGKDAEQLSDTQVLEVINVLTLLAKEHFSQAASSNITESTIQFERSKDDNDGI